MNRPLLVSFLLECCLLLQLATSSWAWLAPTKTLSISFRDCRRIARISAPISQQSTSLLALPENYRELGEELIFQAAAQCGASPSQLEIDWKQQGKIIVTVRDGNAFLSNTEEQDEEDEMYQDEESLEDMLEEEDTFQDEEYEEDSSFVNRQLGVDVVELAKAINTILDDDGIGLQIAETHGIEVTTPGASEELSGIMWKSYQGFDCICQFQDTKTQKTKTIEGRLHGRDDEYTTINIKGRLKKIENDSLISVKLPKAKKEKGAQKKK